MDTTLEAALADEILAEVARQRLTATEMQRRTGIKSRSWQNWLRNRSRPLPLTAAETIAEVLGMPLSELVKRAEHRVEHLDEHEAAAERALRRVSPEAAAEARAMRREIVDEPEEGAERAGTA